MLSVTLMGEITEARPPVVLAPAPGDSGITLGLPSANILWSILLGNGVALVVYLWKSLRDTNKEDIREIKEALKQLSRVPHDVEEMRQHLRHNVPSKDLVEVMIHRAMKEKQ